VNYTNKPTLVQTDDEYLLFIHPAEKERAKVVSGYRWDPTRRCWVYPKLKRVHDALFAEFGDELDNSLQPDDSMVEQLQRQVETVTAERDQLRTEAAQLRAAVAELSADGTVPQQELRRLREAVHQRDARLAQQYQQVTVLQAQVKQQQAELEKLRTELDRLGKDVSVETRIKYLALEATGNSAQFAELLDDIELDENALYKLYRWLERQLRAMLHTPGDSQANLNELIQQVTNSEALTRDAVDLAHIIRKQRNLVAHTEVDASTCQAHAIICLFAAALLWPELQQK